jgi:hypothetical protein
LFQLHQRPRHECVQPILYAAVALTFRDGFPLRKSAFGHSPPVRSGNSVIVSWQNTGICTLQTNNYLATTNWNNYGGTNSVTVTPPTGNLFFRLKQ